MGQKYLKWQARSGRVPSSYDQLQNLLLQNRSFDRIEDLVYGDHGMDRAREAIANAIRENKRIALYADYDVDGTMSCVSWIWFFEAIGFKNYVHYIPCRFKEGYGVNLEAVRYLIDKEKAQLIITMDTGITANEEAAYCKAQGVEFICTDHHVIQTDKMPDCIILNPKQHPDPLYQQLCGCGITFVLIRQLGKDMKIPAELWNDLLALAGMATICDVVPLNSVNHRLAQLGVRALMRSRRPVIARLREAASLAKGMDEKDVGFRLGPRINAVGRLGHADQVVAAFIKEDPSELIEHMNRCNEERKKIQAEIVVDAAAQAHEYSAAPILFLGGDWHPGVVGIAASKIAEKFWKPTWLFQRKDGVGRGSARSIPGFDVTEAMGAVKHLFKKFGGHTAAGGFTFELENEKAIREGLCSYAEGKQKEYPSMWESQIAYDCELPLELADMPLLETLDSLKPFGHGFEEPRFAIEAEVKRVQYFEDKMTGEPKHTAVHVQTPTRGVQKLMFFHEVVELFEPGDRGRFIVAATRNTFRGNTSLSLLGHDFECVQRAAR